VANAADQYALSNYPLFLKVKKGANVQKPSYSVEIKPGILPIKAAVFRKQFPSATWRKGNDMKSGLWRR